MKKYFLGGMLLLICVSMVWYLVPSSGNSGYSFGGPAKGVVAKVDGSDITADQVRQQARQMAQQQAQQYGKNASMIMPFLLQQSTRQAAEQLITRQALVSEAEHMGMRVTPQEVQDDLQHGRYAGTFFPGGTFIGQNEYEEMLSRANLTPVTFEDAVGKDLLLSKLRALIAGSATVSEKEIRDQFVKQNTKVKFDYAVLKQDDVRKGLHPTEAELKAFYDSTRTPTPIRFLKSARSSTPRSI